MLNTIPVLNSWQYSKNGANASIGPSLDGCIITCTGSLTVTWSPTTSVLAMIVWFVLNVISLIVIFFLKL